MGTKRHTHTALKRVCYETNLQWRFIIAICLVFGIIFCTMMWTTRQSLDDLREQNIVLINALIIRTDPAALEVFRALNLTLEEPIDWRSMKINACRHQQIGCEEGSP